MNDAPHTALARNALVAAARRLATSLTARGEAPGVDSEVRALERAAVAYVSTHGGTRDASAIESMVVTRVHSALWSDDGVTHAGPVIALVTDIAKRAVVDALPA